MYVKKTKCQVPLRPLLGSKREWSFSLVGRQNIQAKEVYTSQSSATRKPGGTQQMFIRGGSTPRTKPLPFIYHFNRCKCTVFQIRINHNIERFPTFSSQKNSSVSPFGLFYRPKWQISLPFNILQLVKSLPFDIPEAWKRFPFRGEPPRLV